MLCNIQQLTLCLQYVRQFYYMYFGTVVSIYHESARPIAHCMLSWPKLLTFGFLTIPWCGNKHCTVWSCTPIQTQTGYYFIKYSLSHCKYNINLVDGIIRHNASDIAAHCVLQVPRNYSMSSFIQHWETNSDSMAWLLYTLAITLQDVLTYMLVET